MAVKWTPGNAAPSRNQLAERFGIARETAARAHAWLASGWRPRTDALRVREYLLTLGIAGS